MRNVSKSEGSVYKSFAVESELCLKSGPLFKIGKLGRVLRYYVLKQSSLLKYQSENAQAPKTIYDISKCEAMPYVPHKGGPAFQINVDGENLVFYAHTASEVQLWLDALREVPDTFVSTIAVQGPSSPRGGELSPRVLERTHSPRIGRGAKRIEDVYIVGAELAQGNHSRVCHGIDKQDETEWALKIVERDVYNLRKGALDEQVAIVLPLHHPNIMTLREVISTPKQIVIVMELMCGGDLFERIVEREKYTEMDAKKLCRSLVSAVAYMHENGIVHRDITPENIVFDATSPKGNLKLTDFGFATRCKLGKYSLVERCGTPDYVAPEIIADQNYGHPVDMWSIGVVTYVILCGFPPFFGESDHELFDAICECRLKFSEEHWGKVSEQAKDFIRRLLVLDPVKRMTAKEALAHPWLADQQQSDSKAAQRDLSAALTHLRRYRATKKFKNAVHAIVMAHKLESIFRSLNMRRASGIILDQPLSSQF